MLFGRGQRSLHACTLMSPPRAPACVCTRRGGGRVATAPPCPRWASHIPRSVLSDEVGFCLRAPVWPGCSTQLGLQVCSWALPWAEGVCAVDSWLCWERCSVAPT